MRTSQRAVIAIVLALGALVVATVASASPGQRDPIGDQPTSTPVAPGGGGPGTGTPQVVEPTPGMDNVRPTAFDTATIGARRHDADDRLLERGRALLRPGPRRRVLRAPTRSP